VVVLPWNDQAEATLTIDEIDDLEGFGGTDPTTLIRDRHHRQALLNSSLWVLLTDGQIADHLVQDFATGIGNAGLHGTASIIICVGSATMDPAHCNISVGKSVFSVVPDCMILFHDVLTEKVFVFQCKGRFKALLSKTQQDIVFSESMAWTDLPQISYEILRDFAVPKRRELSFNTVLLTSGKKFDLNDIYNDTLDPSISDEILSNDDDLKTLLLTASTRGRKEDVQRWISKKKLRISDPIWISRPDPKQRAHHALEQLVGALRNSASFLDIARLRGNLRSAHEANWDVFTSTVSTEIRNGWTRDVHSPSILAPVSPPLSISQPFSVAGDDFWTPQISPARPSSGAIFTQGYRCKGANTHGPGEVAGSGYFTSICGLCERRGEIMALILQKPEENGSTPNHPRPHSTAKHKYPFVLGNFPDVDVISPEIYCETCSVYLVRQGRSPKSDAVLGALPLVQDTLMKVFESRFHKSITLSVFLSVLYNTLNDLTTEDSDESIDLTRAIRWTCPNLLQTIQVSRDTSSPTRRQQATLIDPVLGTLAETIPLLVKHALQGHGPLLSYPIDGFLVVLLAAKDIDNENCEREGLRCAIWLRLATHFAESYYICMQEDGKDSAREKLSNIVYAKDPDSHPRDSETPAPMLRKSCVPLASLEGTLLCSSDDWETFRRLGNLFAPISSRCGPAMAVYLHCLLEYSKIYKKATECFKALRKEKLLRKVFVAPEEVNLGQAADLISRLQTWVVTSGGLGLEDSHLTRSPQPL
ncbi:hypothetical protein K458DRAFT_288544, partial [Lentithecium fluviatile CBS 122367]